MDKVVQKIEARKPLIPKRIRVCAYARVSSGKDEMLHSLSAQISYYSEYIQSCREWEYAGVYADEAITGTKENRPEFQRMIANCKAGDIDMIITKSISRFARNTVALLEMVRMLKSINVDVYFEKENIHSISGDGELMLTILASFAQEESLSVSENCKWRIRKNFEEGLPNGFTLYGYDINKHELTVNEDEASVIREIYERYISGQGSKMIANALNEKGILSPKGSKWHKSRILQILKNEKYIGDLLLQKYYSENHITKRKMTNDGRLQQYYVLENHKPIIDREVQDKVKQIIAEKNQRSPYIKPYDYRFKDMVFCGNCGAKYTRKRVNTGTVSEKYVWKCYTYSNKGKRMCAGKQIPDDVLTKMAEDFDKRINKIIIRENNRVQFVFDDGTEIMREWEVNRKWTDEMKTRNYHNQRRRYL